LIHQLKIKDTLLHCKEKYGEEYFCGPLHHIIDIVNDTAKLYTINEVTSAETFDSLATPINEKLKCIYCLEVYSRSNNLKRHIKTCKEKDDTVRLLELHLDIPPYNIPKTSNTCRYCDMVYSRKASLNIHLKTCKAKQKYRETLEAKLQEKTKQHVAKQSCFERLSQK